MTLKERLTEDFKQAMKAKDDVRKSTISFVRAAIKQVEIDTRKEISEDEVLDIIEKQVKMRKDALSSFKEGGREDLVSSYESEIKVLETYLPDKLPYEEIEDRIIKLIEENKIEKTSENIGKMIALARGDLKRQAEGNTIRQIVLKIIND